MQHLDCLDFASACLDYKAYLPDLSNSELLLQTITSAINQFLGRVDAAADFECCLFGF